MSSFSKRHGHRAPAKEITVREDAPHGLREFLVQLMYSLKYEPTFLRTIICRILKVSPDRNNWSEWPNIDYEVQGLLLDCEWYYVYDIIEAFYQAIETQHREEFSAEVNDYFIRNGIGWKVENGQIETRGDELFETSVSKVSKALEDAKLQTAKGEMQEALRDLSRRPEPDITGAIQHALACLECVCREASGNKKATLGEILKKHPNIVPKPLDSAVEKLWGFASEQGRHLREGQAPEYVEVELVVEITAAIATYLGKKLTPSNQMSIDQEEWPW